MYQQWKCWKYDLAIFGKFLSTLLFCLLVIGPVVTVMMLGAIDKDARKHMHCEVNDWFYAVIQYLIIYRAWFLFGQPDTQ